MSTDRVPWFPDVGRSTTGLRTATGTVSSFPSCSPHALPDGGRWFIEGGVVSLQALRITLVDRVGPRCTGGGGRCQGRCGVSIGEGRLRARARPEPPRSVPNHNHVIRDQATKRQDRPPPLNYSTPTAPCRRIIVNNQLSRPRGVGDSSRSRRSGRTSHGDVKRTRNRIVRSIPSPDTAGAYAVPRSEVLHPRPGEALVRAQRQERKSVNCRRSRGSSSRRRPTRG